MSELPSAPTDPQGLYEQSSVWNGPLTAGQAALVDALALAWPAEVDTAIDVGCGDGKLAAALRERVGTVIAGVDFSREALRRADMPVALADASSLPFGDYCADLALSIDMLEHVVEDSKGNASAEVFRIAKRYVAIAVPYRENLSDALSRCSNCATVYHLNWHQRAYAANDLRELSPPGWRLAGFILSGESWMQVPAIATDWMAAAEDQWADWSNAICPACGASGDAALPTVPDATHAVKLAEAFYQEVERSGPHSRNHTEILALFARGPELATTWSALIRERLGSQQLFAETERRPVNELVLPSDLGRLDSLLLQLPQIARALRSSEGQVVVQSPAIGNYPRVALEFPEGFAGSFAFSVEDGIGVLAAMNLDVGACKRIDLELSRPFRPGLYGVLLRMNVDLPGVRIRIGGDRSVFADCVKGGPGVRYLEHTACDGTPVWNQVSGGMWLGKDQLDVDLEHQTLSADQLATLSDHIKEIDEGRRWPEFIRLRRRLLGPSIDSG